jgi:hypothetical protein
MRTKNIMMVAAIAWLCGGRAGAQNYSWTTIAGLANTPAYADGTNNAAFFNNPRGVAVDSAGNVFTADASNYVIRKTSLVGSNWVTTTIAGLAGNNAFTDGTGNAARFNIISTLQLDGQGNIYVQDFKPTNPNSGYSIRKIAPVGTNWVVTTIYKLWDDISGWAVDPSGNYYTASNYAIIQLTPVVINGILSQTNFAATTLAGFPGLQGTADGTNIVARFLSPNLFSVDSTGTVFLKDNGKLRSVSPSGGNWITATINQTAHTWMALDSAGNIYGSYATANSGSPSFTNLYYIRMLQVGTTNWAGLVGSTNGTTFTGVAAGADGTVYVADNGASVIRQGVTASLALGGLQVALQPSDAANAGAAWRVDAGLWQTNGATVTNLMAGSNHVLSFLSVYGWASPSNQWVTISSNATTTVTGNYVQQFGSIQVNLTPPGATNAGARWQVDSGAWQTSGTIISNLTVGIHMVSFTNITGFITPASQTNVNVIPNQTTIVAGNYIALGAVLVNLNPAGAVSAGAQWQLDGGVAQNSSVVLSNVSLGSHTISFLPASGWITPSNQTVTVNSGQTNTVTGNYVVLGSLQVAINPAGAVNGGAQWQVDGGTFQNSGNVVSNLAAGAHTISYSAVTGYVTPTNQTLNINPGGTTNITATYVALGAVSVSINPTNAVNAGAQWALDGGAFQNSGVIVSNVALGSHSISYLPTAGFITPSNVTVTVISGQTTNVNATYVALGNIQVTINPTNAVNSGALWALDGGALQNSGVIASNISLGSHTISYLPLSSWITPSNQVISVVSGQTTNITATYIALGSLQVFIAPIAAVSAGAVWRVDSNAWQTSGSVVTNLVAGNHTVAFTNIVGWTTPTNQVVTVSLGLTAAISGVYVQQFGNVQVVLSPVGAVGAGAKWQLDNGIWQNSGVTLANIPAGNHMLGYASLVGWTSPTNQTILITSNQTAHLTAIYTGQGSLQVVLVPTNAILTGAMWQVDGGNWLSNNTVVSGLNRGTHTVGYKPASGWVTPATQAVTIVANQTTLTNGSYQGLGYTYTTIAGMVGDDGYADGTNHTALFSTPVGMVVDLNSNLLIADTGSSVIRKLTLTTNGWVSSTLAGLAGFPGSADGTNSQARFDFPTGLALDANGTIYVADQANSTIRKLTADGTNWLVTTIAGLAGSYGNANGTNSAARFYYPAGLTVDAAGSIYVADQINSAIRKLIPTGSNNWAVSTIAGTAGVNGSADGVNNAARFFWPSDVKIDGNGTLFVADSGNSTIRKVALSGANYVVTTISGAAGANGALDGTNNSASFDGVGGIALDNFGSLYVADSYNSTIRKITPVGNNWIVNTIGGLPYAVGSADGVNAVARFNMPYGVCVDNNGVIYVADTYNQTIRAGNAAALLPVRPDLSWLRTGTNISLSWPATIGLSYQVQFKTNLLQTTWLNLGPTLPAINSIMSFVDSVGTNGQKFYRVWTVQ